MKFTFKAKGFKELEQSLIEELPKATARNVLRRAATNALEPVAERMSQLAPRDSGTLAGSMRVQPARAKLARAIGVPRKDGVVVLAGPGPENTTDRSNAFFQEFGTVKQSAQPYARPAADTDAQAAVRDVRRALTEEVEKAKARIARKAARDTKRLQRELARR